MGHCINCLFQGDNGLDEKGRGTVFCMVKRRWMAENDSCPDFTEYADLSKEIRSHYAFDLRTNKLGSSNNKMADVIKQSWKAMIVTLIISFIMFILAVKIFDKYIF